MDLIRHGLVHVLQELPSPLPVCLVDELGQGDLARAVDPANRGLAFSGLDLNDVDMGEPCGIALELLPFRHFTLDTWRCFDAMALQAAMLRRACQLREALLRYPCDLRIHVCESAG